MDEDLIFTKIKGKIVNYLIQSVARGKDALGEVTVRVKFKDKKVIAHGTSTDILEASAKSYINEVNKVLSKRKRYPFTAYSFQA